ncbi:MAG: hypothetical protein H8D78_10550 [Chloroflexi bacterium]|nr:hypothetical protein [Chloroflexota bacterium]
MNAFNRIITLLLFLALLLVVVFGAIFPTAALEWIGRSAEGWSSYLAYWETARPYLYVVLRIGIVILAVLVFGILLFLELRRRRPNTVRVHTTEGSTADVTTDSVSQRLLYHIDRLADVVTVAPRVSGRGKVVDVVLDLETGPEVDVPMKTDEVVAVAREVIEERMGLQLGKINVRIKHAPYPQE